MLFLGTFPSNTVKKTASDLLNISDRPKSLIVPDLGEESFLSAKLNTFIPIVPVPFLKEQLMGTDYHFRIKVMTSDPYYLIAPTQCRSKCADMISSVYIGIV